MSRKFNNKNVAGIQSPKLLKCFLFSVTLNNDSTYDNLRKCSEVGDRLQVP